MLLLSGGFSAQEDLAWDVLRENGLTYQGAPEFVRDIRHTPGRMWKRVHEPVGVGPCCVPVPGPLGTAALSLHISAVGVTHLV